MLYLLLAIAAMSAFMLTIKMFAVKSVNVPRAIIVNYILAAAAGFLTCKGTATFAAMFGNDWWYLAVMAGAGLFSSMHLMAISTRLTGVAVTTISSRTALILPIIFSFFLLGEPISTWEGVGIGLVILALIIIFYNRRDSASGGSALGMVLTPLSVFFTIGIVAVCMKFSQHIIGVSGNYDTDFPLFQAISYISALILAAAYYAIKEGRTAFIFDGKSILGGVCLGSFNFLATLGILHALKWLPTGVFYAAYNIGVVIITSLAGWLWFGEKLGYRKTAGIVLAIVAIAVLMFLG